MKTEVLFVRIPTVHKKWLKKICTTSGKTQGEIVAKLIRTGKTKLVV